MACFTRCDGVGKVLESGTLHVCEGSLHGFDAIAGPANALGALQCTDTRRQRFHQNAAKQRGSLRKPVQRHSIYYLFFAIVYRNSWFCAPPAPLSYIIELGVCYLTLCERAYPKKLAFAFLEELQKEFWNEYGREVGTAARPYAFIKFGMLSVHVLHGSVCELLRRSSYLLPAYLHSLSTLA